MNLIPLPFQESPTFSKSSDFSTVAKTLLKTPKTIRSSMYAYNPSPIFAANFHLSTPEVSSLLRGPLIQTPESLKALQATENIPTGAEVCGPNFPLSHQQWQSPKPVVQSLSWMDLMVCHQDFSHLVELSTQAVAKDPPLVRRSPRLASIQDQGNGPSTTPPLHPTTGRRHGKGSKKRPAKTNRTKSTKKGRPEKKIVASQTPTPSSSKNEFDPGPSLSGVSTSPLKRRNQRMPGSQLMDESYDTSVKKDLFGEDAENAF
ncbi:MAG: hypothetical protein SGILL_007224 [Bacillariaceae sp.]